MVCPITQGDHKKPEDENIMSASATQGGHKKPKGKNYNGMRYSIGRP